MLSSSLFFGHVHEEQIANFLRAVLDKIQSRSEVIAKYFKDEAYLQHLK